MTRPTAADSVPVHLRDGAVVNLDGVVNRPAYDALRRRDLDGYLVTNRPFSTTESPSRCSSKVKP